MSPMEIDDYRLCPSGRLGGKVSVSNEQFLGEFDSTEDALGFVLMDMECNQYYPSIWWVSDHGNAWMIDAHGVEIKIDEEDDAIDCYWIHNPAN